MMVEASKIVGIMAEKSGQSTIDLLQLLLHEEIGRAAQGTVRVRFFVDDGFEGEVKIEVREVKVRTDGQKLIIAVDGYNGELVFELSKALNFLHV